MQRPSQRSLSEHRAARSGACAQVVWDDAAMKLPRLLSVFIVVALLFLAVTVVASVWGMNL